jgi:hypothetical protein
LADERRSGPDAIDESCTRCESFLVAGQSAILNYRLYAAETSAMPGLWTSNFQTSWILPRLRKENQFLVNGIRSNFLGVLRSDAFGQYRFRADPHYQHALTRISNNASLTLSF